MTTITNKHGLPEAFVEAIRRDPYRGGGDISVTKLLDAPQRRLLWAKHHKEIEEDASDRVWSLLGQGVHSILERGETDETMTEKRIYAEVEGWVLSGQFDRLHMPSATLSDYKVTTTYKSDGSDGWIQQLNILRWLCAQNGLDVERLEIVAIFRDWRKADADRDETYPQAPVKIIPVPVWTLEEAEDYIRERIRLHQAVSKGQHLPCSEEERWYSGTKYAIQKPNAKRALKVLEEEPAEIPDGYVVVKRPGVYRRCASYCDVAPFCVQWQDTLKEQGNEATGPEATD